MLDDHTAGGIAGGEAEDANAIMPYAIKKKHEENIPYLLNKIILHKFL